MASVGIGLQIGAQKVDVVLVLNDKNAVRSFESHGQMKLGGDYSIAAGPLGRNFSADVSLSGKGVAGTYSYSMSQGAFAGFSLEGQVLVMRGSDNKSFYNQKEAHLSNILAGTVPVPEQDGKRAAVHALHQVLLNIARNVRYDSGLDRIDPAMARDINGDLDDDDEGAAEAEGVAAAAAAAAPKAKPPPPIDETPHGHNITDDDDLVRAQRKAQQAKQKQQQEQPKKQQQTPAPPPPAPQKQQPPQQQQMVKATATATATATDTATPNVVQQQQAASGKNLLVGALDMHQQPAGTGWGESTDLLGPYAPPAVVATPNPYATATATATPNPYATATATPNPYATATPNPYDNPYATTAAPNPYDNPYDNPYAAAAPNLFEPYGAAGFPGAAAPSALPGYGAALPATGLLATNGFAAPPAPELLAGLPRLVVVRDHAVDELSPAIAAHSIITVHRGDPLYLVDGTVTQGMAPPYADYVTVQRLADGRIGKVSRFCVMDG